MRPRHKAAENDGGVDLFGLLLVAASMRPRHKAAENVVSSGDEGAGLNLASMRPRHKAAENGSVSAPSCDGPWPLQ